MEFFNALGCFLIYGGILFVIIMVIKITSSKPDSSKSNHGDPSREKADLLKSIEGHMDFIKGIPTKIAELIEWSFLSDMGDRFDGRHFAYYESSDSFYLLRHDYKGVEEYIDRVRKELNHRIEWLKKLNESLAKIDKSADQSIRIANVEYDVQIQIQSKKEAYSEYGKKIIAFSNASKFVVENEYGTINRQFLERISKLDGIRVEKYSASCYRALMAKNINGIYKIEIEPLMKCLWWFAIQPDFNAAAFENTKTVLIKIYKGYHPDVILAEFYTKRKKGTVGILQETLREAFANHLDVRALNTIASGLKGMGLYSDEKEILKYMAMRNGLNVVTEARLKKLTVK